MFKKDIQDEELYVLVGRRIGGYWFGKITQYNYGQPHEVRFDADYVLDNPGKVIGWVHTHPMAPGFPSRTDHATMTAWYTCLGKPLVCCIDGNDGVLRAHWYFDDESEGTESKVTRWGKYLYGPIPKV